jgi:hypothetical protein
VSIDVRVKLAIPQVKANVSRNAVNSINSLHRILVLGQLCPSSVPSSSLLALEFDDVRHFRTPRARQHFQDRSPVQVGSGRVLDRVDGGPC